MPAAREVNGERLEPVYGYRWHEYLLATDSETAYASGHGYWVVSRVDASAYPAMIFTPISTMLSLPDALTVARIDRMERGQS